MKYAHYYLITLASFAGLSCSKSNTTPDPVPVEENLTAPVAGIYKLTKVTNRNGNPTFTGVGSMTIIAVDNTTAKITQIRSFTNSSTRAESSITSVREEANKIAKDGSNYVIKSTNGLQWATISSTKISTVDKISTLNEVTLDTEYTKQ